MRRAAPHGRELLGTEEVQGPGTGHSLGDRRRSHRLALDQRPQLVGDLLRHDALPTDRPHARPQPQHAFGRGARPPVGGNLLPREQSSPTAVNRGSAYAELATTTTMPTRNTNDPEIGMQGTPELGGRPVGQPAVGQAQGRGRIPRLGRGGPRAADDAGGGGRHGLLRLVASITNWQSCAARWRPARRVSSRRSSVSKEV